MKSRKTRQSGNILCLTEGSHKKQKKHSRNILVKLQIEDQKNVNKTKLNSTNVKRKAEINQRVISKIWLVYSNLIVQ